MKITILGCGTSTGVPMVGCTCPVCTSTEPRDTRTRSSVLVEYSGRCILIDTSTDLRRQALREKIRRIDAVLFTHPHADHIHGIDDLRGFHFIHRSLIPCYGSDETMRAIARNFSYIFKGREDGGYAPLMEPRVIEGPFDLFGKTIRPVELLHGSMTATGYRIGDIAYLTDCSAIPESSLPELQGLDTLIIDALRYTPHENHFNIPSALEIVKLLAPRRAVLTHLTHEVPYRNRELLPPGVDFAYDGMVLKEGD